MTLIENFSMLLSYFKNEILTIREQMVPLGSNRLKMWTEVSSTGFGTKTSGRSVNISGSLSQAEMNLHNINEMEVMTVSIVIKKFKLFQICLPLETENETTILCIRSQ